MNNITTAIFDTGTKYTTSWVCGSMTTGKSFELPG